jgi:hypothetical protein
MTKALLTLNTTIPAADHDGTPVVIIYDNGDWEIAFAGDVYYIREGNDSFHSHHAFSEVFVLAMIHFETGDEDDLDVSDGIIYFEISEVINVGDEDEPVLVIFQDGECDVTERYHAQAMADSDNTMDVIQNFIPLFDLFKDFSTFRARHEELMFGEGMESDEDDDDDVEDENE